jgi:hypothetical protein
MTSFDGGASWQGTLAPSGTWVGVASSADGRHLMAVSSYGSVYLSTNSPAPWFASGGSTFYGQCAASSAAGTDLFAGSFDWVHNGGSLLASADSGASWNTIGVSAISIAASADGSKVIAAAAGNYFSAGQIYSSSNVGGTWTATSAPVNNWQAVASSADGRQLVAITGFFHPDSYMNNGSASGPIYSSMDSGASWRRTGAPSTNWSSVACSADGSLLVATVRDGGIFLSADSGASWAASSAPATNWSCVAASADGSKLVAVVCGGGIWTLQTMQTPRLSIAPSGANLLLFWIVPSMDFMLQQNSDLTTTNWMDLTNTPALSLTNLEYQVLLPASAGNRFYRLKH